MIQQGSFSTTNKKLKIYCQIWVDIIKTNSSWYFVKSWCCGFFWWSSWWQFTTSGPIPREVCWVHGVGAKDMRQGYHHFLHTSESENMAIDFYVFMYVTMVMPFLQLDKHNYQFDNSNHILACWYPNARGTNHRQQFPSRVHFIVKSKLDCCVSF